MAARGEFSSKMAFVLAAAGSAIGLGNIWGFPIQVAQNGGGAFVFTYVILTFMLAYPVLMAELIIGRYAKRNTVDSMVHISTKKGRPLAYLAGYWGMLTAVFILAFYSIIAGWMIAYCLAAVSDIVGWSESAQWLQESSLSRNLLFAGIFYFFTIKIVASGVADGIEKWSTRLMPALIILIILLITYIATLPGASDGWRVYLQPDFSQVLKPDLVISALGQAFFSLSLGVGTMMIYGSYISRSEDISKLGASVAAIDICIAFLAGLLVIPAMYVALHNGVEIYNEAGKLIDSDGLIFNVLPALFDSMGAAGAVVALLFFTLMTIAAVTSSISMLEVPVAFVSESRKMPRAKAAWLVGLSILFVSSVIIFNFSLLFGLVVKLTTQYSQPLVGLLFCIFVGWIWNRNEILKEIKHGAEQIEHSWFWRIWPSYIKFVCPLMIGVLFWHSLG